MASSASGKRGARGQDAQADRGQISYLHRRYFLYLITHPASSLPTGRGRARKAKDPDPSAQASGSPKTKYQGQGLEGLPLPTSQVRRLRPRDQDG